MSFFQRVFGYVINEVVVNGLANNRAFQRFAIRSNEMVQELSKRGAEQKARVGGQAQEFLKTFNQEVRKGMDEHFKK